MRGVDRALPDKCVREVAWRRLTPEAQKRFGQQEELPSDILVALAARSLTTLWGSADLNEAFIIAARVAAAQPEELYLPAEHKKLAF